MKKSHWMWVLALFCIGLLTAQGAFAQEEDSDSGSQEEATDEETPTFDEEIVVLGTRKAEPRSIVDSPVPIDVIDGEDFNALGSTADLTDNLRAAVPSYTATPATGDGSAFVRPTSLRGTAPDQTLVLVNGKRRHRSALVQFFAPAAGNGAHGADIGMIPGIAVERVEVLRDGAASQYGSDAIAGVINFQLKDNPSGWDIQLQGGEHYDGESSLKAALNGGFRLPSNGFFNVSGEYLDNDALSRGVQRPDAQAFIDMGVSGVGTDAPFGDAPLVQTWGRPETSGGRLFFNAGLLVNDSSQFYFMGGYADTEGRYRFFYRNPYHPSLVPLRLMGFTGLPGGYTPFLDGDQTDTVLVTGLAGLFTGSEITYDFSLGYGKNELDYFLNNTINQSLGLSGGQPAQRDFDAGAYEQEETNFNADFAKSLRENFNLGFGFEWREETYSAIAGEPNSYFGAGSNGLRGISPRDAGDFSRDNWAIYGDLEHDITDNFLLQYALRYEDFSDFGDTVNWKLATRYNVTPKFTLRGAASTGFHAPTPGQANVRTTITTFDGVTGEQVDEGLVPPTSESAIAVGGTALTEETSLNFSAGFTARVGSRTAITFDLYSIAVDDRIYRTGDIAVPGFASRTISFYTNALDVESEGADLVISGAHDWSLNTRTDWNLALGYNKLNVVDQVPIGGILPVSDGIVEDIENNYPNERFVLAGNTIFGDAWNLLARINYYGSHYDERGRIGAQVNPSFEIGTTVYLDLEVGYRINDAVQLALGAVNVFDEFVDEIGPPYSNRLSVGLQYPRRSAANYEGGSVYLRARFTP